MKTDRYIGYTFESDSMKTPEFKAFARAFKSDLKDLTANDFDIVSYNIGHFYMSGFLQSKLNGKFVYFSVPDVRSLKNDWQKNILIRTAENDKDYTGGRNNYTTLEDLNKKSLMLIL